MHTFVSNIDELVSYTNITWLLAPLNKTTHTINTTLVEQLPGDCMEYRSFNSVPDKSQGIECPTEFLEVSGLPPTFTFIEG